MEWDSLLQTRWRTELRSSNYDAGMYRERSPSLPMHEPSIERNFEKYWWRKKFFSMQRGTSNRGVAVGAIIAVNIFLQNLYHVSQSTKLWTPKHGETWRRNVMNNLKNLPEGVKQAKCVKTLDSQEPFPRDSSL